MIEEKTTRPDFTKSETLSLFQRYLKYLYDFDIADEAYNLVKALPNFLLQMPNFAEEHPYLYEEYKKIFKSAKILALPFLPSEKIIEIFRTNLLAGLTLKFPDFLDKLEAKLVTFLVTEERDALKANIRKAMEENQETIGKADLIINGQNKPPTVANWLLDYKINLGEGEAEEKEDELRTILIKMRI